MGTVSGANTRRYHGHLVAAVEPPATRVVLLAGIEVHATVFGRTFPLSTNQYVGALFPDGFRLTQSFSVGDYAEWVYQAGEGLVRKRLAMHPGVDACTIEYANVGKAPVQLTLRPLVCHKPYHGDFRVQDFYPQRLNFPSDCTELTHDGVSLFIEHPGAARTPTTGWYYRFEHHREIERGLQAVDDLFCPCELTYELAPGEAATLVAATSAGIEPVRFVESTEEAPDLLAKLRDAAEKFIVRAEARSSIIAGYPWFTDWGRDTMIALPGVCLHTGHTELAREILSSYAFQMRQGLLPNRFVESGQEPEYNTVDASLWFANAIYLTLKKEWHEPFARAALGWLREMVNWHIRGTFYGIQVDPEDGLLTQGEEGVQLTWMDAKVGDWVITPRHGKPVEVNGLWVNALRVGEWLAGQLGEDATLFHGAAERAEVSFERKFWHPKVGHYLDTVDPDDASLRPNQVIAMGLPFSPMRKSAHAKKALDKVTRELLTPYGLRTLGPKEAGYHGRYEGALPERDAAYHQGTVWPWLLGSYACALARIAGQKDQAVGVLRRAERWLEERGLGGIAEVYDGDAPQRPDGCPWQAWSVGEVLRALVELTD